MRKKQLLCSDAAPRAQGLATEPGLCAQAKVTALSADGPIGREAGLERLHQVPLGRAQTDRA